MVVASKHLCTDSAERVSVVAAMPPRVKAAAVEAMQAMKASEKAANSDSEPVQQAMNTSHNAAVDSEKRGVKPAPQAMKASGTSPAPKTMHTSDETPTPTAMQTSD